MGGYKLVGTGRGFGLEGDRRCWKGRGGGFWVYGEGEYGVGHHS